MPDLSWTASLDVTHVSKALSKIDREAKELGVSFDKSFKTADEAVKYLQENISGLETALVRLKKEQSDVKLLPDSEGRTERLKELKTEIDDVTTSLRQNKKWQQELSKAQKEDVGNTNTQINSFRSLFTIFQAGTKTSHSLAGGFKAINAALKANPFGVVLLAAVAVVGVFKKLYNSLQPVKNLVDGISNAFNSLGTSIANALGMETVSQHEAKIKQLEEQKEKLDDLKESVSDIDNEIDKLKEKNKTPKQRLSEIDSQISDYEKAVDAYQSMWDKKSPQWQKNNSRGVLATNLEGAKKQLELAKLQREEIQNEIDEADAQAKKSQAEKAERLKKQAEEFDKKRQSYLQALLDDSNNLKYAPRQREINWMEEGHDKVMAQIELDYEKEIDSIKKYESQKIAEYNKLYGKNYATIGELPQSVREPIQGVVGERTQNAESQRETSISNYYNGILSQYQDFETQRKNIRDKYAEDAELLRKKDTEESKAALAELERAYKKELEANSVEQRNYIKANSDVLKKAFGGSTIKTKKELEEVITILENYKAVLGAENEADALNIGKKLGFTDEETKKIWANGDKIQEEIEAVTEDIDNLKQSRTGLKKIGDDFKNLAKSAKAGGLDFQATLDTLLNDISAVANALGVMASRMQEIADISGNTKLQTYADGIATISKLYNSASAGAKIGGGIGAVVGFGLGAINEVIDSRIEQQKAAKELRDAYAEIGEEIEHNIYLEEIWKDTSSIFGNSVVNSISDSIDNIDSANEKMSEKLAQIQEAYRNQYKYMYDLSNSRNQEFFAKDTAYFKNIYDEYTNETLTIQQLLKNVRLKDGQKIEDFDIYNTDGSVNITNLEKLVPEISETSNNKNLDNIQELFTAYIEYAKDAETATEELTDAYESLFGGLSNSLADDLINAFSVGTDAGEDMSKTVSKYFQKYFVEAMSDDITKVLNKYGKDLEAALNSGDEDAINAVKTKIDSETNALIQSQQTRLQFLKDNGYLDTNTSLSSSTAKGIAQASQDSVDELNGRFTAIQSHTYSINENMKEMQTRQSVILNEIMGIHTDTSSLKTMFINGTARVKIN